jgi:hypothetical protein
VALAADLGIGLAKAGPAFLTGSAAMAAEVTSLAPKGRKADYFTQPFQPTDGEGLRILGYPGVTAIRELLATFVGPGRVWVIVHLEIDDTLRGDQVTALVRGIDSGLKLASEYIHRVDVVPLELRAD